MAVDIEPYVEYAAHRHDAAHVYTTDLSEAAQLVVEDECKHFGCSACQITELIDGNLAWQAYYLATLPDGMIVTRLVTDNKFYACHNPPAMYVVTKYGQSGPGGNQWIVHGTGGGSVVCRYGFAEDSETRRQADIGAGDCTTRPNVGNPINVGLNNKYQEVVDISAKAGSPLEWSRYYNSGAVEGDLQTVPAAANLGSRWRGTYDRSLVRVDTSEGLIVRLLRHTGERLEFIFIDGEYRSAADPRGELTKSIYHWTYRTDDGETEQYDLAGRLEAINPGTARELRLVYGHALTEIIDAQRRRLRITYDAAGRIVTISDDIGVAVTYAYDEASEIGLKANLVRATYADGTFQAYHYNEPGFVAGESRPHALTGIQDETGVRFATFRYDADGRAISSEHVEGADATQLVREADGTVAVTGPLKSVHRYRYAEIRGVKRLVSVDQPGGAGCAAASAAIEYDDNGLVARRTGFDGRVTTYKHDTDGNETERTDAADTPSARTITTEWHAELRKPLRIAMPGREERFTYDTAGNVTRRELWGALDPAEPGAPLTLSRAWRMTYDRLGRRTQYEGPRSDTDAIAPLATYAYREADATGCSVAAACDYRAGDLWKITNALGHVEEFLRYDAAGRVLARRDAVGTLHTYRYAERGWLLEIDKQRPDGSHSVTRMTHNERGDIVSLTDPDGVRLVFDYDKAGRLVQISNPSGHRLRFKLDPAGNRIQDDSDDGVLLATQLKRSIDALGRVETETRDGGGITRYTYDALGRPTGMTDADGRQDSSAYDGLGRLREAVQDVGGVNASTRMTYDPLDQLTGVEDAKGVSTRYLATGLGDVGSVDNPDGGVSTDEHDAAGLLRRHEGPAGIGSFDVARDALGRPLTVTYGDSAQFTRYAYDSPDPACAPTERHATGRLSSVTQGATRTTFCYDAPGNVTRKIQQAGGTTQAVSYRYSPAGRLLEAAVDGGARTTYRYDKDGSVSGIATAPAGGAAVDVISKVAWRPFDLFESWTYGNGRILSTSRDANGWITSWGGIETESSTYALARSPAGQIDAQIARSYAFRFDYDGLGHVGKVTHDGDGTLLRAFEYDATGDRQRMTVGGNTQTYLYDPSSHRLSTADGRARRYDAAGNTIAIGDATLDFDAAGRLVSASEDGRLLVTYGYDALGQRIARTEAANGSTTRILYDEQGHWLADYDGTGKLTRQAVWFGDYLVGLVDKGKLLYVEPDHLGGPRAVVDPANNVAHWRWRPSDDPFGTAAPDEDPDGDGVRFVFDLRFPGQRYDALTGLHYNYFRDYDPATGRYIEVDPIGLAGGINPYLYAEGAPLMYSDPLGLYAWGDPLPNWLVDFSAGMGDTVSFGATRWARRRLGTNDVVDQCSSAYVGGELAGFAASVGTGLGVGIRAAGVKAAGKEFSHWIPTRMGGPRSIWNGNFVTPARHYYHDPFRYPRGWRDLGNKFPGWLQQIDRIPNVYKGTIGGIGAGAVGLAAGQCGCR